MIFSRIAYRLSSAGAVMALLAACAGHPEAGAPINVLPAAKARLPATGSERVLYSFTGGYDGGNAAGGLAFDRTGDLYGTTVVGGDANCGTVFKLAPNGSSWHESVSYSFSCYGDGKNPHGGVIFYRGDLDGTTVAGGTGGTCTGDGCGVVFQLTPKRLNTLYDFTGGNDGFGPGGGLTPDSAGHLFGTTPDGGASSEGVVYEVSRNGRHWHQHVLHAFTGGKDGGVGSLGSLLYASPALYGVAELGGAHGAGTVYKITPTGSGGWKFATLYAFKGTPDAGYPYGGLVADASGNLFGTTYYGGANGAGAVYELVRNKRGGYRERVLYSFKGGSDGSYSTSTLIFGTSGSLYGTTSSGGGSCDCGTIFSVDPKTGAESVVHAFGASGDGAYPYYGMTADAGGNLYGTTVAGGNGNQGTVFEFTP